MKRIILATLLLTFAVSAFSEEITDTWKSLNKQYAESVSKADYDAALKIATELNAIDPADTNSLLYIVYASVKAKKAVPDWVLSRPWPNATPHDVINRLIAESLANGT